MTHRRQIQFETEKDMKKEVLKEVSKFLFWVLVWVIVFGGSLMAIGLIAADGERIDHFINTIKW